MEQAEQKEPRPAFGLPGPAFLVAAGLLFALSAVLAFVPLFDLLGYEFCAAVSLLVSMTAGPVAIGVVRRRPAALASETSPLALIGGLYIRAAAWNLATLVLPLVVILLNALRVKNCDIPEGLLFFGLLPVATALVCSAWGTAVGLACRRRVLGGACYALLWLAVAALNLWEFWAGPQMDSYNQLTGWIAGPIFEEVIEPGWPLLFARLYGIVWGMLGLVLAAAFFDINMNRVRPGVLWRNRRQVLLAIVLAVAATGMYLLDAGLGFGRSMGQVESVLSGVTRTSHFVIHHPPDMDAEEVRLLAADHEFRLGQIERQVGEQLLPTMHSYVFANAASKRRLVGAGRTQFAKPWQFSMYLNDQGFPHPILKHELTHVVAGGFGSWPLRASARAVLWQNVGLIEGLAVAVDWPAKRFDPHTWSAAMRRIDKAPQIGALFDPLGFWTQASGRAYTLAGSFVRYLLDRYEPARIRQSYQAGTLEGFFDRPPEDLFAGWEKFLDAIDLAPAVEEAARLRFARGSIFQRTCAHEIAALRHAAATALAKKRHERATELVEQMLGHLPGDPATLRLMAEIKISAEDFEAAAGILSELVANEDLAPALRARIGNRLGDVLVELERPAEARARWLELLESHIDDATDRLVLVKLKALTKGDPGLRVLRFLKKPRVNAATLLDLREVAAERPAWATIWYLIGRQLFNRKLFEKCVPYLEKAGKKGLTHPALAAENMRLLVLSYYRLGEYEKAGVLLWAMGLAPRHPGERLWITDWLERLHFDRHYTPR